MAAEHASGSDLAGHPPAPNAERVRTLLADSLLLWQVEGEVTAGEPPAVARIATADGTVARVEPAAADDLPIRWWVRWQGPTAGPGGERSRPCTSIVGLLRTVRTALDVEVGQRLRIAPAGPDGA